QSETGDGTLGYDDTEPLQAQRPGTVTALRSPGRVVERGEALYWLDAKPVTLMYGSVPMWRRLNASSPDGPDIRELEQNLVALGYDPYSGIEIDDTWDPAATTVGKRWPAGVGLAQTG